MMLSLLATHTFRALPTWLYGCGSRSDYNTGHTILWNGESYVAETAVRFINIPHSLLGAVRRGTDKDGGLDESLKDPEMSNLGLGLWSFFRPQRMTFLALLTLLASIAVSHFSLIGAQCGVPGSMCTTEVLFGTMPSYSA